MCLHAHALYLENGMKWEDAGFCWDINWSIGFGLKKNPGEQHTMACPLRGSRFWYQGAQRYLLGLEGLYAHGFRRSLRWSTNCPGVTPEDRDRASQIAQRHLLTPPARGGAKAKARGAATAGAPMVSARGERGTTLGPRFRA